MGKVLIITSKYDVHSDFVISKLNEKGLSGVTVRFNTEDFITNCNFTFKPNATNIFFKDSERQVCKNELISVWYRRPEKLIIPEHLSIYKDFILEQANATLDGYYFSTNIYAKWINPLDVLAKSRQKIFQLELAFKNGFLIPDTIVSNSVADISSFFTKHPVVSTKSLFYPNAKVNGDYYPIYNRIVDKTAFLQNIQLAENCPTIFQKFIDKKYDIRVIVIGKKIIAFAIHSQENNLTREDVRGTSPLNLKHEIITLPKKINEKILTFVECQGLVFSAIDLVLGKDNQYYFLENNPNGQWLWLELQTGYKISDLLIDELLCGIY